jgi:peroxiredoxin
MNATPDRRKRILLVLLSVLAVVAGVWGGRIQREFLAALVLKSSLPSQSAVDELVASYPDPVPFLTRLWNTGKVAHRQMAMEAVKGRSARAGMSDKRLETLLVAGAGDSDASVRELALGALAEQKSPLLFSAARAQLRNADPLVRLLGVQYLARTEPAQALPVLIALLDDVDLRVVTRAEAFVQRWTGIDDGVRILHAIPRRGEDGLESVDRTALAAIKAGIERRKAWWLLHAQEYPIEADSAQPGTPAQSGPPAPDFALQDLTGKTVHLSDWRGKIVILNFWATWCTACFGEIEDFNALHQQHTNELVILGICLDGVPDDHGHLYKTAGDADSQPASQGHADPEHASGQPSIDKLTAQVARFAKARHVTYPVLMDPSNSVGSRFLGGELPTNVLIDSTGHVRRRFIGSRPLSVWHQMLTELGASNSSTP